MEVAGADLTHDPTQIRIHDFRHYFVTLFYLGSRNLKGEYPFSSGNDSGRFGFFRIAVPATWFIRLEL